VGSKDLPPSVRVNVVLCEEVNVPEGEDPICWMLVTTLPIDTDEDLVDRNATLPRPVQRMEHIRTRSQKNITGLGCGVQRALRGQGWLDT
ncbi:hypothetical protein, partial [Novipirellula artificiosorum]|uniref:hypothetical protein n=1 Tax=Novipirellula artificiosorum TaxID=2528016 RepID=UPI0018CFD8DC